MGLDPEIAATIKAGREVKQPGADYVQSVTPEGYKGSLDLSERRLVRFPNGLDESNSTPAAREDKTYNFPPGSHGTENSVTEAVGTKYVILPSIFNGKVHSRREAVDQFLKTGHHMGQYPMTKAGLEASERDSQRLHEREQFLNGQSLNDPAFTGY